MTALAALDVDDGAPWVDALRLLEPSAATEGGLHEAGAQAFHEKLVTRATVEAALSDYLDRFQPGMENE
jgi:hypothetical protein